MHLTQRYARQMALDEIGVEGQDALARASVLVVGLGGLGAPVAQYLAAAGVGRIGLCDFDRVDESNLQRQVLYRESDVGMLKTDAARNTLTAMNSDIELVLHCARMTDTTADLVAQYDLIIDCTDSIDARYALNDSALAYGKPLIYGALHRFEGQLSVFNYENGPCYRCYFPSLSKTSTTEAATASDDAAASANGDATALSDDATALSDDATALSGDAAATCADDLRIPTCAEVGVLGVLPGIIGAMQANEALKLILKRGEILSGRVLFFDALKTSFSHIDLKPDVRCVCRSRRKALTQKVLGQNALAHKTPLVPPMKFTSIDARGLRKLMSSEDTLLIDVRRDDEYKAMRFAGAFHYPLEKLQDAAPELVQKLKELIASKLSTAPELPIVFYCRSGMRSRQALNAFAEILSAGEETRKFYNLEGGVLDWYRQFQDEKLETSVANP